MIKISIESAKRLGFASQYDKSGKKRLTIRQERKKVKKQGSKEMAIKLRKRGNLRYFRAKDCK